MTDPDASPATPVGEWIIAALLVAALGWTTLCLGGYRPETMVWSWVFTGSALAVHLGLFAFSVRRPHPAGVWVLPFIVYAATQAGFVSPVPWLAWRDWLVWVQMAVVFWVCLNGLQRRGPRNLLVGSLMLVGVIAVALACYQRFLWPDWLMLGRRQVPQFIGRAAGPFGIPNSLAAFLLLLIPLSLALTLQRGASAVQRIAMGYVALVLLLGLGLTISRGAWLSLTLALIIWPLCRRDRSLEWRLSVSLAAFTVVVLAGIAVYASSPRVQKRFDQLIGDRGERSRRILWKASWELFKSAPVLGTGAGSFNVLFERQRPAGFNDNPEWAHNEYLNTLSDYGAVGFALSFGVMGFLAARGVSAARKRSGAAPPTFLTEAPEVTQALGIGLLAFAFSLLVDFHFKIPALGFSFAVVGAECIRRSWPAEEKGVTGSLRQIGGLTGAGAAVVATLGFAIPLYRSEALRYSARQSIDRLAVARSPRSAEEKRVLSDASQALTEAAALHAGNSQAWSDQSYVAALWTRLAPARANELGREAESSARKALSGSEVVPEFWLRLGVALDLQGRWAEGGAAFARAVELAPSNATVWYYQAYHLSLLPASRPLAGAALATALRLDPSLTPAIRLQQNLSTPASVR